MGLLFVGGIMSLAWIAAIAVLVLAERPCPGRTNEPRDRRWAGSLGALTLAAVAR